MHIERKIAALALAVLAITASVAVAQVAPQRRGGGGTSSQGTAAAPGAFDALQPTYMQQVLFDLISWKQMLAHEKLGGSDPRNYNSLSATVKDARMEVIRACNLYHRSTLTTSQQETYDRTILDPKGHPLPAKWENMRLKGTLVSALLKAPPEQQNQAAQVLSTFRDRNIKIWGTGHKNGGYAKHLTMLEKEFRAILNKQQAAEFDQLWTSYQREVNAAIRAGTVNP
jgi:hypothetical protein